GTEADRLRRLAGPDTQLRGITRVRVVEDAHGSGRARRGVGRATQGRAAARRRRDQVAATGHAARLCVRLAHVHLRTGRIRVAVEAGEVLGLPAGRYGGGRPAERAAAAVGRHLHAAGVVGALGAGRVWLLLGAGVDQAAEAVAREAAVAHPVGHHRGADQLAGAGDAGRLDQRAAGRDLAVD